MPTQPMRPVMVGVDGSEAALAALELAAEEATARVAPLVVVQVLLKDVRHDGEQAGDQVRHAHRQLDAAVERTRAEHPMLSASGVLATGEPGSALVSESAGACLLVLGHRGGRVGARRADSVTGQVIGQAQVPVLIHRPVDAPTPVPTRPVVVGVADPSASDSLLEFAFEEAALRGTPLMAMHVCPSVHGSDAYGFGHARPEAEDPLAAAVALWADKYPEVPVRRLLRHGVDVVVAITAVSHSAQLVVVGVPRCHRSTGPTSGALAHRAGCPVAVVPLP
jgi:nucleotide-binding universal stress UspA family protein